MSSVISSTPFSPEVVHRPEILAPAGDMPAALAALAAGADAIYLGFKHFSARMLAENFSITDLASLTELAHKENRRVYVALNTMLKPSDIDAALRLIRRATLDAAPDAFIVQDLGVIPLIKEAGFTGEIHLSTLANVSHQKSLLAAKSVGATRVVLPRELALDEVKAMGEACPQGVSLEIFVHGALCYCVSGRCWWSSYMGGKSGLRGRCVQPCRRTYTQKGREGRFFSCLDLSLDVLVKNLLAIPAVGSWKIEGRKKSPHYVYHVVSAYRLLRDEADMKESRKEAERLLTMALGRTTTRSLFIPAKGNAATGNGQTGSGLQCGRIERDEKGASFIRPRIPLFSKDLLRIGYEDEDWHATVPISKDAKEGEVVFLRLPARKTPKNGTPVFLIDRKSAELQTLLRVWEAKLLRCKPVLKGKEEDVAQLTSSFSVPVKSIEKSRHLNILLRSSLPRGRDAKSGIAPGTVQGLWLSPRSVAEVSQTLFGRISWWLPPVIWPNEEFGWEKLIHNALRKGARHFVCNEPWQIEFFKETERLRGIKTALCAGPFCNIANTAALSLLKGMGFTSAIISPELGEKHLLSLPKKSPLPLGIVIDGFWPMGITRHGAEPIKAQSSFSSPKGETFWIRRYGQNTWLYPSWPLDLSGHLKALEKAGYTTFITMGDYPPKNVDIAKRTSEFNWNIDVL